MRAEQRRHAAVPRAVSLPRPLLCLMGVRLGQPAHVHMSNVSQRPAIDQRLELAKCLELGELEIDYARNSGGKVSQLRGCRRSRRQWLLAEDAYPPLQGNTAGTLIL